MAKKKNRAKWLIIILILFLLISAIAYQYFESTKDKPIIVTTTKVTKRTITQTVSAVGRIQPETEVKITSEASGEIIFLNVKEGDTVRAGQIIVRIKPDIIETQLEQYKAAADATRMEINIRKAEKDKLQSDLQRNTELFEKGFISKQEFERAKAAYDQALSSYMASLARYEQALATLKQFQRSADRTTIFAPINGIVTKLNVEKGEKVVGTAQMQGTEILRISDLSMMNAVVDVDENDIVFVKIGDTASIEIDAFPDKIFTGRVVELGHSAKLSQMGTQDQVTNFEIKIRIIDKEPRLRPGMSCNVEIMTETVYDALSVPLQAVTVRDTSLFFEEDKNNDENDIKVKKRKKPHTVVFLKDGNKAKMILVETGISDKGFIEIKKGLSEGDEIISGSFMAISKLLKDGALIKIDSNIDNSIKKK